MEQLTIFDNVFMIIEQMGCGITKAFSAKLNNKLDDTYKITKNNKIIIYLQDNHDGTYNLIGFKYFVRNLNVDQVINNMKKGYGMIL